MYDSRSESDVVRSRSFTPQQPYASFAEAREFFLAGKISWPRTTPEMWREFLEILATDLGKPAKNLNSKDFSLQKCASLGGKLLDGLIGHIERRLGLANDQAIWFVKRESGVAFREMLFYTGEKADREVPQIASTREAEWRVFSERRVPWGQTTPDFHRHLVARQALRLNKDPFDIELEDLKKSGFPDWGRNLMTLVYHYAQKTTEFRNHLATEIGLILKKDSKSVTEKELAGEGVPDPNRTLVRLYRKCSYKTDAERAGFKLLMLTIGFSEVAGQQRFNFDSPVLPTVKVKAVAPKLTVGFKLNDNLPDEAPKHRVKQVRGLVETSRYLDAKGQKRLNFNFKVPVYKYPKGKLFNFGPAPRIKQLPIEAPEIKRDVPGQQRFDFRVHKYVYPKGQLFRGGRIYSTSIKVEEQEQPVEFKDPRQSLLDFSLPKRAKVKKPEPKQLVVQSPKLEVAQPLVSQPVPQLPPKVSLRDAIEKILSEQDRPISVKKITRLLRQDPTLADLRKAQVRQAIRADEKLKADARIKRQAKPIDDHSAVDLIVDQQLFEVQQKFSVREISRPGVVAPITTADYAQLWKRGAALSYREKVFGNPMVYLSTLLLNPGFYKNKASPAEFSGLLGRPLGLTDQFGRIHIPLLENVDFPITVLQKPEAGWEVEVIAAGVEKGFVNVITRAKKEPREKGVINVFIFAKDPRTEQQYVFSLDALTKLSGLNTFGQLLQIEIFAELPLFLMKVPKPEKELMIRLLTGDFDKAILAAGYAKEELMQAQGILQSELTRIGKRYKSTEKGRLAKLKRDELFISAEGYLQCEDSAGLVKMLFDQAGLKLAEYSQAGRLRQILTYELAPNSTDLKQLVIFLSEAFALESPLRCKISEISDLINRAYPLVSEKKRKGELAATQVSIENSHQLKATFIIEKSLGRSEFEELLQINKDYRDIGIVFVVQGVRIPGEEISAASQFLAPGVEVELIISGSEAQRRAAVHSRILKIMLNSKIPEAAPPLVVQGSIVTTIASELLGVGRYFKDIPGNQARGHARLSMAQSELFEISQKVLANTAQMPLKTKLLFQKTIFSLQLQCCELLVAKKFDHEANDFLNHTLIPALSQARNSSSPYYAQQFEDFQKSLERIMLKVKGTEAEAVYLKSKFGSLLGRKIDS